MRLTRTICAIAAASLFAGTAFAQDRHRDDRNDRRDERHDVRQDVRRDDRQDARQDVRRDDRHDARQDVRRDFRRDFRHDERHDGPGAGPDHRFYRGGRLPDDYRGRQYVVDDWRGHHLNAPPRGYHWVQTGGDYVLAAIATGVIASIILNNR